MKSIDQIAAELQGYDSQALSASGVNDFLARLVEPVAGVENVGIFEALEREQAEIAMAAGREEDGQLRNQPVFCLLRRELLESLVSFTHGGGRKIDAWTALHKTVAVPFDRPGDDPRAFFNANTLAELHALEKSS